MEKIITEAVYNNEDKEYYVLQNNNNKSGLTNQNAQDVLYGSKIYFLENKINLTGKLTPIKTSSTIITKVTLTDYIELGDIVCINNKQYICLYFDRTRTILSERIGFNINMDNIFQLPSQSHYLKVGKAQIDELEVLKKFISNYRGLFREIYVKTIERNLALALEK